VEERDWAIGAIEVQDKTWNMSIDVVPGDMGWIFKDVAEEVTSIAGRSLESVDMAKAIGLIDNLFRIQLVAYFSTLRIEGAEQDFNAIVRRPDFSESMPWTYLINFEAEGVAAYNLMAKQLRQEWPETLAVLIRAGKADRD
jgi:hypothetical protein